MKWDQRELIGIFYGVIEQCISIPYFIIFIG